MTSQPRARPGTDPAASHDRDAAPRWVRRALGMAVVAVWAGILLWRAALLLGSVHIILVAAWFVSLAMDPLVAWLVRRRVRRTRATGLVVTASLLVIAGRAWLLEDLFVSQLVQLVSARPSVYEALRTAMDAKFGVALPQSDDLVTQLVQRWGGDLGASLLGAGGSLISMLFTATSVPLVTYYMNQCRPAPSGGHLPDTHPAAPGRGAPALGDLAAEGFRLHQLADRARSPVDRLHVRIAHPRRRPLRPRPKRDQNDAAHKGQPKKRCGRHRFSRSVNSLSRAARRRQINPSERDEMEPGDEFGPA